MKYQKGFTAIEIVLVVALLAILGAGGYFAYTARQNTAAPTASSTPTPTAVASTTPSPSVATKTDEELASAAAQAQCEVDLKGTWSGWSKTPAYPNGLAFSDDKVFARGATACVPKGASADSGGYSYSVTLKKQSGTWSVIYRGTEAPGAAWAKQYGAPEGWFDPAVK